MTSNALRQPSFSSVRWWLTAILLALVAAGSAQAGTGVLTTLHRFTSPAPLGALILGNDGDFYGTTQGGGNEGFGTVFKVTAAGVMTPLHEFQGGDGAAPAAALLLASDGNFYGTTSAGGTSNNGTIFQVSSTGAFKVLHGFSATDASGDNGDGADPVAALIEASDGNLYGTSAAGGRHGFGTVFMVSTTSGELLPLHDFTALNSAGENTDGAAPRAGLLEIAPLTFYGTASSGGAKAWGTIFEVTAGKTFTIVHAFARTDGGTPLAALIKGSDGNFYGTASLGGANYSGIVFEVTSAGVEQTFFNFGTPAGDSVTDQPVEVCAPLIEGAPGVFYGTSLNGGDSYKGTIFKLAAGQVSNLYSFLDAGDGGSPRSGLVEGADGDFYGTVPVGGLGDGGTIFKVTAGGILTTLDALTDLQGQRPGTALTEGPDGNFYGTTAEGGTNLDGTVFRVTPAGVTTVIHNFDGIHGAKPEAPLVLGSNGLLYGTTSIGGTWNNGTIFQISTSGSFKPLHRFSQTTGGKNGDGITPLGVLVQATDGNLYGTAFAGGLHGLGTIFRITPGGITTTLHHFGTANGNADGVYPVSGLIQATDGNLYGTAGPEQGYINGVVQSVNGAQTIYRMSLSGVFDVVHTFMDGRYSVAALVQASNGVLYGTTPYPLQSLYDGAGFSLTLSGTFTYIHGFTSDSPLIQAKDGNLYGFNSPTDSLVQVTLGGSVNSVYTYPYDKYPAGPLIQAGSGAFYGTTLANVNESIDQGTVYQLILGTSGSAVKTPGEAQTSKFEPRH